MSLIVVRNGGNAEDTHVNIDGSWGRDAGGRQSYPSSQIGVLNVVATSLALLIAR